MNIIGLLRGGGGGGGKYINIIGFFRGGGKYMNIKGFLRGGGKYMNIMGHLDKVQGGLKGAMLFKVFLLKVSCFQPEH